MNEEQVTPVVRAKKEISRSANGTKAEVVGRLYDPGVLSKGSLRTFHICKRNGRWWWKDRDRSGSLVKVNM